MINPKLSEHAKVHLAERVVLPIIGPSAIGKDTIIEIACKEEDFHRANGLTSRPKRETDSGDEYRVWLDTATRLDDLLKLTGKDEIVQWAPGSEKGPIYATSLEDYPNRYNVLAAFSNSIEEFEAMGFEQCISVYVVAPGIEWLHRFNQSRKDTRAKMASRVSEGIQSIEWALSRSDQLHWVNNNEGTAKANGRFLIELARGEIETPDYSDVIFTAHDLLTTMQHRLEELKEIS